MGNFGTESSNRWNHPKVRPRPIDLTARMRLDHPRRDRGDGYAQAMPDSSQPPRRFPPPWTVEETAPCFIVRDANGQALAFVYCEDEPGRRATAKLLTRDEARRIAANSAKLPEWLRR